MVGWSLCLRPTCSTQLPSHEFVVLETINDSFGFFLDKFWKMKFGEYLKSQKSAEWEQSYLDYDKLKHMIKELEENKVGLIDSTGKGIALHI